MTVGDIIAEPLALHGIAQRQSRGASGSRSCSRRVGLRAGISARYPHEFSGGQRQRIGIARALAPRSRPHRLRRAGLGARRLDPGADLNLLEDLQSELGLALPVHRPRPRGREAHRRSRRGDVSRPHRRDARRRTKSSPPAPSLYRGAPFRDPVPRPRRAAIASPGRRRAKPDRSAAGLSSSSALRLCHRSLPDRRPPLCAASDRSCHRLSSLARIAAPAGPCRSRTGRTDASR